MSHIPRTEAERRRARKRARKRAAERARRAARSRLTVPADATTALGSEARPPRGLPSGLLSGNVSPTPADALQTDLRPPQARSGPVLPPTGVLRAQPGPALPQPTPADATQVEPLGLESGLTPDDLREERLRSARIEARQSQVKKLFQQEVLRKGVDEGAVARAIASVDEERFRETPGVLLPDLAIGFADPLVAMAQAGREVVMDVRSGNVGLLTGLAAAGVLIPAVGAVQRTGLKIADRIGRAARRGERAAELAEDLAAANRRAVKAGLKVTRQRLFHYSDRPRTKLDPAFAGTNPGIRGAERNRPDRLPAMHFYTELGDREAGLGKVLHETQVEGAFLDMEDLPENIVNEVQRRAEAEGVAIADRLRNASVLERVAAQNGYAGLKLGKTVSLFYEAPTTARTFKPAANVAENMLRLHTKTGGSTIDTRTGESIKDGFLVSAFRGREKTFDHIPTVEEVNAFMDQNADLLADPNNHLGSWFNKAKGTHELNISNRHETEAAALQVARAANQDAIYDAANQREIFLPGSSDPKAGSSVLEFASRSPGSFDDAARETIQREGVTPAIQEQIADQAVVAGEQPPPHKLITENKPTELVDKSATAVSIGRRTAGVTEDRAIEFRSEVAEAVRKVTDRLLGDRGARLRQDGQDEEPIAGLFLPDGRGATSKRDIQRVIPNADDRLANQLQRAHTDAVADLVNRRMPALTALRKLFQDGFAGAQWYDNVRSDARRVLGIEDGDMFTRFFAVTAQNGKDNADLTRRVFAEWKAGEPFGTRGALPPEIKRNLGRVADGLPPLGSETRPLHDALLGDPDAIVLDPWAMRAFGFRGDTPTAKQRQLMESAIRADAQRVGLDNRHYQAAVWRGATANKGTAPLKEPAPNNAFLRRIERAGGFASWLTGTQKDLLEPQVLPRLTMLGATATTAAMVFGLGDALAEPMDAPIGPEAPNTVVPTAETEVPPAPLESGVPGPQTVPSGLSGPSASSPLVPGLPPQLQGFLQQLDNTPQ